MLAFNQRWNESFVSVGSEYFSNEHVLLQTGISTKFVEFQYLAIIEFSVGPTSASEIPKTMSEDIKPMLYIQSW